MLTAEASLLSQKAATLTEEKVKTQLENYQFEDQARVEESKINSQMPCNLFDDFKKSKIKDPVDIYLEKIKTGI